MTSLKARYAEAEGDPQEMEKALFEIRKLVAQALALSA